MKLYIFIMLGIFTSANAQSFLEMESGDSPNHLVPVNKNLYENYDSIIDKFVVTNYEHGLFFDYESAITVYESVTDELMEKYEFPYLVPHFEKTFHITYTKAEPIEEPDYIKPSKPEENGIKKITSIGLLKIKRFDYQISARLAIAIQRSWAKMIMRTTYPQRLYRGLDGQTYQFSVFVTGLGFIEGEIWQPENSILVTMVDLGNELKAIATKDKPLTKKQEETLIKKFIQFEKEIDKM